jgi:hypothetical protein
MAVLEIKKDADIRQKKQTVKTVKTYQFHEAAPLSITKVPKGQPKLKVFQPLFRGAV